MTPDYQLGATPASIKRRRELLRWMKDYAAGGLVAMYSTIGGWCPAYNWDERYVLDKVRNDLKYLMSRGFVSQDDEGGWSLTTQAKELL